ncbi:hypothetical protein GGH99_008847, partial [Coemansia sp. RSA 1285]
MSKRQNTIDSSSSTVAGVEQPKYVAVTGESIGKQAARRTGKTAMDVDGDAEMGGFEDAYEDEIEEEEVVEREEDSDG